MSALRRREKAIARRSYAVELDVRQGYIQNRIPRLAVAAMVCPCGFAAWLMPGGSEEDRAAHDQACNDHDYLCDGDCPPYEESA